MGRHCVGLVVQGVLVVRVFFCKQKTAYEVLRSLVGSEMCIRDRFMNDRIDAAKTVEPSRCGWGMMLSLAVLGPIYSVVYTVVAINPEGILAKMTAPDSDIPKGVEGAKWYDCLLYTSPSPRDS